MSVQPRELTSGRVAYYITFGYEGRTIWEHAGYDRRAAERLEKQRIREVADGTYSPEVRGSVTNAAWFEYFWTKRNNRGLANDQSLIRLHVLSQEWFADMLMHETRPRHVLRMIETIQQAGVLSQKTIANAYGVLRQAYARAVFEERIATNPCALPKGVIRWRSSKANARKPYTRAEVTVLIADPRIERPQRVWNALALHTGMRMGEVCGRRWRDWKRDLRPLTGLLVHTQYDDQPLKTDDEEDQHPRLVPVHPRLQAVLEAWWTDGWEYEYGRTPTLEDFIVPNRFTLPRARATAYDAFQRALKATGLPNRTVHATRHAFISIARSGGARKDVIERVTHNARGDIVDGYTDFEWLPLCEAVLCFDSRLDPIVNSASFAVGPPGFEVGPDREIRSAEGEYVGKSWEAKPAEILAGTPPERARFDARQTKAAVLQAIEAGDLEAAIHLLREKVTEGQ